MNITINYTLTTEGQKVDLKAGGNGHRSQVSICDLGVEILDLTHTVTLRGDGTATANLYSLEFPLTALTAFDALKSANEMAEQIKIKTVAERQLRDQETAGREADAIAAIIAEIGDGTTVSLLDFSWNQVGICQPYILSRYTKYYQNKPISELGLDQSVIETLTSRKAESVIAIKLATERAERLEKLPTAPKPLIAPTVQADGTLRFAIPASLFDNEHDWAKFVTSVDLSQTNGMAFVGEWLKSSAVLAIGDVVVVGGKEYRGSKRNGTWQKCRTVFVATSAGFVIAAGNTPNDCANLLNLAPDVRVETTILAAISQITARITEMDLALADPDNADFTDEINSRRAVAQSKIDALQSALDQGADVESVFADQASAALAIITAGYRALSAKHHPDQGGSLESMILLNAGRDVLKALLDLAQ